MATYRPDPDAVRAQIESIRAQTDTDWTCVISDDCSEPEHYAAMLQVVGDDPRFAVSRRRSGSASTATSSGRSRWCPPTAQLIALSDQDDVWHPDKLATLRASIGSAALVYSDQRLTDAAGAVLRDTMWVGRREQPHEHGLDAHRQHGDRRGHAHAPRGRRARAALSGVPGMQFHDHWLALIALASGALQYVDRPLYDYVQHRDAVLGRVVGRGSAAGRSAQRRLRVPRMREWRGAYFLGYLPRPDARPRRCCCAAPDTLTALRAPGARALHAGRAVAARLPVVRRAAAADARRAHRDARQRVGAGRGDPVAVARHRLSRGSRAGRTGTCSTRASPTR